MMNTIGNCFAFGILLLVVIAYSKNRYFVTTASKYFVVCLALTAMSSVVSTLRIESLRAASFPVLFVKLFATLDFALLLLTTSILALYLIAKITEHNFSKHHMRTTSILLFSSFALMIIALCLNLRFGYIFSIDENCTYVEGELAILPYALLIVQILVVIYHCLCYLKSLTKSVKVALIECLATVCFCFVVKFLYSGIQIFVLTVTLIELIFFMHFQQQSIGISSITKLNDSRSFIIEINRRIKKKFPFKVYLVKIRNYGTVREAFGHKEGDEFIYQFASSLDKLFDDGIAFHMYSATFALVFYDDREENHTEAICTLLDSGVYYMNRHTVIDYTVAEHHWNQDEATADAFYEKLEYASEVARSNNQKYICCTLDLEAARLRKKYLISRMQSVTKENGFEVWFQPIYSNAKKRFSSVEALLRLKEKDGKFISPAEFIPLSEQTGQITSITWFVIEETCRTLAENRQLDRVRASINLPMVQLTDPNFEARLNSIVDGFGLSHDRISFEFTERVIMNDLDLAERNMRHLAKSGYTFYLDDFGIGYSNFNCVLRLPIKTVKLDITITSTADHRERSNLVCSLTDLFHDMGLNVVAEGAETLEQVEQLKSYGIDGIQGYYYSKPLPLPKLIGFFKNNNT